MAALGLPITTIPPFGDINQLPACAAACGHLYDANGACVPPAIPTNQPSVYTACFCHDPRIAAFSTTTAGVCDDACTAEPDGLNSITNWYKSICSVESTPKPSSTSTTSSSSKGSGSSSSSPSKPVKAAPSGDWISNHWQWVIMLVILVVGIAGIWIGACFWRRRYLRKRDQRMAASARGGAAREYAANTTTRGLQTAPAPKPGSSAPTLPNILLTTEKEPQGKRRWFGH